MADVVVGKEYTVYEDDNGREFYKQPQSDGSVKKVYLDDQQEAPIEREPTPREDIIIIQENQPTPNEPEKQPTPNGSDTFLVVPKTEQGKSTPPSRSQSNSNLVILVDKKPQTPQPQEQETVVIVQEPEPQPQKEPTPTQIIIQHQPEPEPLQRKSPDVVYVQNYQPQPEKQTTETVIYINENDPSQGGYYVPSPRPNNSQKRQPYRSTPRSQAGSVSPWQRKQKKEKQSPPPKYQLQPKPDQAATLVGGVLIIDNDPWEPQAKISHTNPNYRRGGGDVVIPQEKLKWKSSPRIDDKNIGYVRGGGNVPILHDHLAWDEKPRIDAKNPNYQRGGGNVVIVHENLKWRKNARRKPRSQPMPLTNRSIESSGQESNQDETLSEGNPSNDESHRDYFRHKKATDPVGGYASQFKGKIHRYKASDGVSPYFDLRTRKPMLKSEDDLVVIEEAKQPPPPKAVMPRERRKAQPQTNVPWFKQKSDKPVNPEKNSKTRQYYPNINKPLPPIGQENQYPSPRPKQKYVLPEDKSLPWQSKEDKVQKVTSKKLKAITQPKKKAITSYNPNEQYYGSYDPGYQDYNAYGNPPPQQQTQGYRNQRQDREYLRENNKYTANHKHHHFPTRKRNEPVY